jgi:alpha-soluble NSF attachment protein
MNIPSNKEIEAKTLIERAAKKVGEFNLFGLLGSRESKMEEASDLCAQAGHLFKIEKKWKEAGEAYAQAAEYVMQTQDRDSAANHLLEASKCFKKTNPEGI